MYVATVYTKRQENLSWPYVELLPHFEFLSKEHYHAILFNPYWIWWYRDSYPVI
jgi:hypothetical protein